MSAMAGMARAIREELEQHAPTLQQLPDDVLNDFVQIVGAFWLDLDGEQRRREGARGEGTDRARAELRGVTAQVVITDWPEDLRYVEVVLSVSPLPGGLDEQRTYTAYVKAPT
jgi:hypothetical protein